MARKIDLFGRIFHVNRTVLSVILLPKRGEATYEGCKIKLDYKARHFPFEEKVCVRLETRVFSGEFSNYINSPTDFTT